MKRGMGWDSYRLLFLLVFGIIFLCYGTTTQAAEVVLDKGEFVVFLQKHKLYKEKSQAQEKLIQELKAHIKDQDDGIIKLTKHTEAADALIEEYKKTTDDLIKEREEREYSIWMERGKGFGVGVGVGLLFLIFK